MNTTMFSIALALFVGALIAFQSSWNGIVGRQLGALNANLLGLVLGGTLSLLILAIKRGMSGQALESSLGYLIGLGVSSILIGTSISFIVQRLGVTTSLACLLLGQLCAAFLIDTFGWGGTVVPLETKRVLGIVLLGMAVYLLIHRT